MMAGYCRICGAKIVRRRVQKKPGHRFDPKTGAKLVRYEDVCPNKRWWFDGHYGYSRNAYGEPVFCPPSNLDEG